MTAVDYLVDSHCHLDHLDVEGRAGGLDDVLSAARSRGVGRILSVAVDVASSRSLAQLASRYTDVYTTVGVHPLQRNPQPVPEVEQLLELAVLPGVVALGETGLDNYYSAESADWQRQSFINHLQASHHCQLPVIVHTRDAREETIALIRQYQPPAAGVLHCFTENWEMASAALDLDFYISLSGIVTFRNASALREVAKKVPLDRLLVETDAPWLAPVPHRGKQNEPQFVRDVAEFIADLRGINYLELQTATTENFHRLFSKAV